MSLLLEPPHTVGGAISRRARRTPDKTAVLGVGEDAVTFAQVASAILSVREQIASAGLARADRVGVVVQPDSQGALLLVAVACNITAVPIDPALDAPALDAFIEEAGVKALATFAGGTLKLHVLHPMPQESAPLRPTTGSDIALLLYAGARGRKPVEVTHRDLRMLAGQMSAQLKGAGSDPARCAAQLWTAAGVERLFGPLILGASVSLAADGHDSSDTVVSAVAERASARGAPQGQVAGFAPADDLLELEVREIWCRLLQRRASHFDADETFFDAGGDSLLATQLLLELEKLAGRPYPESELAMLSIRRIAQVLKERMPAERRCITQARSGGGDSAAVPGEADLESKDFWTRVRAIRRSARRLACSAPVDQPGGGSGIPLFFCHGDYQARGLYAHQLAALLPADQPVYLLHPEREPPAGTTAEALAERYLDEVLRVAPGMPVIVGGYCNGGFVAWHLAHLLRAKGVEVVALLVVETPSLNARPVARAAARLLRAAGRVLPGRIGKLVREDAMRAVWSLYRHGTEIFAARLYRAARAAPREAGPSVAAPSWWILVRSMATRYVPPSIDVEVYVFVADDGCRLDTEPEYWRRLAPRVTEINVPGTHMSTVISERARLAFALTRAIADAAAQRSFRPSSEAPRSSRSPAMLGGQPG